MEVTLDDLLVLEPRLAWRPESREAPSPATNGHGVVSWVVSARTTAPHLPLLRGGEVVLISPRVTAAVGGELPALLREAKLRSVAGVVFQQDEPAIGSADPLTESVEVLVWNGELTVDTETGINRLLTECRGNLYRVGSELERQLTDLAASHAGLRTLVQTVSDLSSLPIQVSDVRGRQLAAACQADDLPDSGSFPHDQVQVERDLPTGLSLVLGPLRPEQRVVAHFLVDRIAAAVTIAARRDEATRPRGSRRIEAVEALLAGRSGNASEQRAAALALGLDPDGNFFVTVSIGEDIAALTNSLAPLGSVHAAGVAGGRRSSLIAVSARAAPESLNSRVAEAKRQWHDQAADTPATLAISAPASGIARLPAAAKEAEFVATLQAQPRFAQRVASFDSIDDIGAFRLLYLLRGTDELRLFVSEALGTLERRDQRGTLRETLRAYLETGGSHADASHRLGIHRNTLAYRLRRIGELIGRDVGDPKNWLTLHLALCASELVEVDVDDR